MDLGERIRELRHARHRSQQSTSFSHSWLSRVETGGCEPSLGALERIAECFDIGLEVLLGPEARFSSTLLLEEEFVQAVLPYLKQLNEEKRKQILLTLEAAPKQSRHRGGRPRSANIAQAT